MSILNVDKIQPIGSGSTVTVNATDTILTNAQAGVITATRFDGIISATTDDWVTHQSDSNTRMGFPATDTFAVETAGDERFRIDSNGYLSFAGDTNTYIWHPQADQLAITKGGGSYPMIRFGSGGSGSTIAIGNTTTNLVTNSEILAVRGYSSFKSVNKDYAALYTHNEGGNGSGDKAVHLYFNWGGANRAGFGVETDNSTFIMNNGSDISFRTGNTALNGTERLRIDSGGSVTIGDAATHTYGAHAEGDDLVIGGAGWRGMTIYGEGGGGVIQFADNASNRVGQIVYYHAEDSLGFRVNGNATRLKIDSSGHTLFSGVTSNVDTRNVAGITVKSPGGISLKSFGANGSRNWRIRPDDLNGWADLDFSCAPTDGATDIPDVATDTVLSLQGDTKDVIVSNGNLKIGVAGKGIDFSITGDSGPGTMSNELLDDYEEGSWSPVAAKYSGGAISCTYAQQIGNYTKIGRLVTVEFSIQISALSSQGSNLNYIANLPYVPVASYRASGSLTRNSALNVNYANTCNVHADFGGVIYLSQATQTTAILNVAWQVGYLNGSITYITAS